MKSLQNFSRLNRVPFLFSIVCLALLALMIFQIYWLQTSRNLIETQFDQKVSLAMGSALSKFHTAHEDTPVSSRRCNSKPTSYLTIFPIENPAFDRNDQQVLEGYIQEYMTCYGINEPYNVEIFNQGNPAFNSTYCCAIGLSGTCDNDYMIGINFTSKDDYLFRQMGPMISSSVLIFLLLASVSFMILWSLVRQKRITENNIDFFNNTAHEFKTPLTNISLAIKLLVNKYESLKEDKYASIIKAENTRLSNQIERILFLSRIESGEYRLRKEVLDIKQILTEVSEGMALAVNEVGGEIRMDFPAHHPKVMGDRLHLSNVFRNLIDNAIKYSNGTPLIEISLTEDEKQVKVFFRDHGIGISVQDQSHIFEKFQRVNTGNLRHAKGFGIGLSYVKTIIEMHKGLVRVKSELNKGSEFQLLIPNA